MKSLLLLLFLSFALAEPSCETLLSSLETARQNARSYILSTTIMQGGNEFAFERSRYSRNEAGEMALEVLEQRGARRPQGTARAAETSFSCEGSRLEPLPDSIWQLVLLEPDPESPVRDYTLTFQEQAGQLLPLSITVRLTVRLLFVPVSGSFLSVFSDWQF